MLLFVSVAIGGITILLSWLLLRFLAFRKIYNNLPGREDTAFFSGDLNTYPGLNEAGLEYDFEMVKKHNYFYRMWYGPLDPIVFLCHPDPLKKVVKSSAPKPRNELVPSSYDFIVPWADGLPLHNGAHWARQRRLLTPAFHFDILRNYHEENNTCVDIFLEQLRKSSEGGQSVEIYQLLYNMTLDVILRTAFSYKTECQRVGAMSEYALILAELSDLVMKRFLSPMMYFDFIYRWSTDGRRFYELCNKVHEQSEAIIAQRRKQLSENHGQALASKKRDFLDILLMSRDEDGNGLSEEEIRGESDMFLFAGHDTTSSGTMWALYDLSKHQEFQEEVFEEVRSVMGEEKDISWEDLSRLQFTTQCIKESLRRHTVVSEIERSLSEELHVNGHVLPKGAHVVLHLWALHHNPHLWENPYEFQPHRFDPENCKNMDPFQFMPFSAGQRNCIGQNFAMNEMKVVIAKTICNFHLSLDLNHKVQHKPSMTMKAVNGVYLHATPRSV